MLFTKASYCRNWLSTRETEVLSSRCWKKKSGCPLLVSCGGAAGDACVGWWEWVQSSEGHLASLPALALHSTLFGIMTSSPSVATSLFHPDARRHGLSEGKSHWIIVSSSRLRHSPPSDILTPQVSEITHPLYYTFAEENDLWTSLPPIVDGGCFKGVCGVRGSCTLTLTILILLQGRYAWPPSTLPQQGMRVFCHPCAAGRRKGGTAGFVVSLFTLSLPYLSLTYVTPMFFEYCCWYGEGGYFTATCPTVM